MVKQQNIKKTHLQSIQRIKEENRVTNHKGQNKYDL